MRPRRIAICGGSRIRPDNAKFCEILGRGLAAEEGAVLITGGFKHLRDDPEPRPPSADWSVIKGALSCLSSAAERERRIETLVPERKRDAKSSQRSRAGRTHSLPNRSIQARRFVIVSSSDALLAVEGKKGTREMIDLALALEKPCLPLPFTQGYSRKRWKENRCLIQDWFDIDDDEARRLESVRLASRAGEAFVELARQVRGLLLHKLKRKCFVMMPFKKEFEVLYRKAIRPAISQCGFEPVRPDHLNLVGDAVGALREAIKSCDCAVAVITGFNPNVMYELGLAHAEGKAVILLCKSGSGERVFGDLPFDVRNEYVIGYRGSMKELEDSLAAVLCGLFPGHTGASAP